MPAAILGVGLLKMVVVGAIVGAVVGGITAAIKGGDIFKGVLFGAVGGAVSGALMYGASYVWQGLSGVAQGAGGAAGAGGGAAGGTAGGQVIPGITANAAGNAASSMPVFVGQGMKDAVVEAGKETWLGSIWGGVKDAFVGSSGDGLMEGAASALITGGATAYGQNKAAEAMAKENEKTRAAAKEALLLNIASNEKIAGMRSSGGGGGSGALTAEEQRMLIQEQNKGGLERVNAEIAGNTALRQSEFANADRIRNMAAAGGAGVSAAGRVRKSTANESLVDIQERIRNGENAEGETDVAYEVPVTYVAPSNTKYVA